MKMARYTIPIIILLISCTAQRKDIDDFDRERLNLVANEVESALSFRIDSLGKKILKTEITYDKEGYIKDMRFYGENQKLNFLERHFYNDDKLIVEIKRGSSIDSLMTIRRNEYDSEAFKEINYEYLDSGTLLKSVFHNDSLGRNTYKEYYKDSVLVASYKFYWCGRFNMCKIQGFDTDGNKTDSLKQTFEDDLLISSIRYENGDIAESTINEYDSKGYLIRIVYEEPKGYRYTTELKYDKGLIIEELNQYTSLTDDYRSSDKIIWEYKKHRAQQ